MEALRLVEFNGTALRAAREAIDMSRELLAGKAGCSLSTIIRVESGENNPSADLAATFAVALDVPLESLFTRSGEAA